MVLKILFLFLFDFWGSNSALFKISSPNDFGHAVYTARAIAKVELNRELIDETTFPTVTSNLRMNKEDVTEQNWADIIVEQNELSTKLTIYPNPTENSITINGLSNNDTFTVIIKDLTGRELIKSTENSVNLEKLTSGFYIIQIVDYNGITIKTEKISKQ